MRKPLWVLPAVLLVFIGAPLTHADTVTNYAITFTLTSGSPAPTVGTFAYDSTVPSFSNFLVLWDGVTFNLTSAANSPASIGPYAACLTSTSGASASFSLLNNCAGNPDTDWDADGLGFEFAEIVPASPANGILLVFAGFSSPTTCGPPTPGEGPCAVAQGDYSISVCTAGAAAVGGAPPCPTIPSPTPEPGSSSLMWIGIVLVLVMRKRISPASGPPLKV